VKVSQNRLADTGRPPVAWLTTFNDMMTLLLVFFVLVFAIGTIDVHKVKHFQSAMQSALGVLLEGRQTGVTVEQEAITAAGIEQTGEKGQAEAGPAAGVPAAPDTAGEASTPPGLVRSMLAALDNEHGIEAVYTPKGIFITLEDSLLFELGRAAINPRGVSLLARVGAVLKTIDRPLRVEGHTDDLPINTRQYPSNWELSTARAVNVVKYFIAEQTIDPQRLSAVGYGAAKPRTTNATPGQRARNRRVEIVLELKESK